MAKGESTSALWFIDGEPAIDLVNTTRFRTTSPADLISTPEQLVGWLAAAAITEGAVVTDADVALAHRLRDALDRAFPGEGKLGVTPADIGLINELASVSIGSRLRLGDAGIEVEEVTAQPARAGLTLIARNAISLVESGRHRRVRYCNSVDCRMRFVDSSALANRRWCSMTVCGNREKARRLAARKSSAKASTERCAHRRA